jgi:hypothetical protein
MVTDFLAAGASVKHAGVGSSETTEHMEVESHVFNVNLESVRRFRQN